jgi:hypothetical protein
MTATGRQASVINRTELKRRIVQYAKDTKYHFRDGCRVSEQTLNDAEALVESWMRHKVSSMPSKGKTI